MKRFTSVLIAVILGAFATGIGTVPFLVLANQDRYRLDSELHKTKSIAAETEIEKQKIAEQANQKVKEANAEVQKAQTIILEAQEDERLLTTSERLIAPVTYERSKWNTAVSLYQGISLLTPTNFSVTQDEPSNFVISREIKKGYSTGTTPLIFIQPYEKNKEDQYLNKFASSTSIAYLAGGRLMKGEQGILPDGSAALELEVRLSAKTTHLIWMRDPEGSFNTLKKSSRPFSISNRFNVR